MRDFFSTSTACGACDKYQVWIWGPGCCVLISAHSFQAALSKHQLCNYIWFAQGCISTIYIPNNICRPTHIYKYDMIYTREITVHISHWARSHWALLEGLELELRALLEGLELELRALLEGLEFEFRGLLLIGREFDSWLLGRWNEPLPAIEPWLQRI